MPATILVIDDDPSIVHLLKESLEGEGHRVLAGYDGRMAMELAAMSKPQLIIMDLNMPEMDGAKALEVLRQNPPTAGLPVLFLTGEASEQLPPGVAAAGRVSHLTKPIELDRLSALVRKLLAQYSNR